MINNFDLVLDTITDVGEERKFYYVFIARESFEPIHSYFVVNRKHLSSLKEEITSYCEQNKATAYIELVPLFYKDVDNRIMLEISSGAIANYYGRPDLILSKCVQSSLNNNTLNCSIEISDSSKKSEIKELISQTYREDQRKKNIAVAPNLVFEGEFPSISGITLLTKYFDISVLSAYDCCSIIHSHKRVVLYHPDSLHLDSYICACKECGNKNLQVPAWIDFNTLKFIEWYEPDNDNIWCPECGKYVDVEEDKDEAAQTII